MPLARGKYAFGFCDKTGFRYNLNELVDEVKNGVKTGLKVGRDVSDPDHPQNFLGRLRIHDPQSLANARPDRFSDSVTVTFPTFDVSTLTRVNVGFGIGRAGNLTTTELCAVPKHISSTQRGVWGWCGWLYVCINRFSNNIYSNRCFWHEQLWKWQQILYSWAFRGKPNTNAK